MKFTFIVFAFFVTIFSMSLPKEADAVEPPLKPLNSEQLRNMIAEADVIATGTVSSVALSKTIKPPLETVTIHVVLSPDKILKASGSVPTIVIEESYKQFSVDDDQAESGRQSDKGKAITSKIAGPAPPVGRYSNGDHILVFLKSLAGSDRFRPLGSGSYDAYLGVFRITPAGVASERYRFDDIISSHAHSEADFLEFISSNKEE